MKRKKYILAINYEDDDFPKVYDYSKSGDNDDIEIIKELTKENLIAEYINQELYDNKLYFRVLDESYKPISIDELMELGIMNSKKELVRIPQFRSDLQDDVYKLFDEKNSIGIFGRRDLINPFLANLIVNNPGDRKIVLYDNEGLIERYREFNPALNNVIKKELHKYNCDSEFNRFFEGLDDDKGKYIFIFTRVDFLRHEYDFIDRLNLLGYKYMFVDCHSCKNKLIMEKLTGRLSNIININNTERCDKYEKISVDINDKKYIYTYDPRTNIIVDLNLKEKVDPNVAFDRVAGFKELKEELKLISSWWTNRDEITAQGVSIPHGILFHGVPGTGKSLIARSFVNSLADCEVIEIDGNTEEYGKNEVVEKFNKAKSLDQLVVVFIDEIDLLTRYSERELLNELDNLTSKSNVFVVATCNDFDRISGALTRRDRLDYIIEIGLPNEYERTNILKYYFEKCKIETNIQYDYLSFITDGMNAADLKGVANETRLRFGTKPTMNNIEDMVDKISKREHLYYGNDDTTSDYMTAVHEVAHAIVASQHKKHFTFYKASLESNSRNAGLCKIFPTKENAGDFDRFIADIEISLAGYMACKELYNYQDAGAQSDMERARQRSAFLVNSLGYSGFDRLLNHNKPCFAPSDEKMKLNERASESILKRCEKNCRRIIRKNKTVIQELANVLMEKKYITQEDINNYLD